MFTVKTSACQSAKKSFDEVSNIKNITKIIKVPKHTCVQEENKKTLVATFIHFEIAKHDVFNCGMFLYTVLVCYVAATCAARAYVGSGSADCSHCAFTSEVRSFII